MCPLFSCNSLFGEYFLFFFSFFSRIMIMIKRISCKYKTVLPAKHSKCGDIPGIRKLAATSSIQVHPLFLFFFFAARFIVILTDVEFSFQSVPEIIWKSAFIILESTQCGSSLTANSFAPSETVLKSVCRGFILT